jgi:hypothetical protein
MENVGFAFGFTSAACADTVSGSAPAMLLPTTWTPVTMSLIPAGGTYATGVVNPFTWTASASAQPVGTASITFSIDSIVWTM